MLDLVLHTVDLPVRGAIWPRLQSAPVVNRLLLRSARVLMDVGRVLLRSSTLNLVAVLSEWPIVNMVSELLV